MNETDLYLPVKTFLERQGYTVKGEVKECDIVAIRGGEAPVIVELKVSFSLQLLLQGIDRQAVTDAVYLAVAPPKRRQQSDLVKLCKCLGLGLLTVSGTRVEPLVDPVPYIPRKNARRKTMLLKEFAHRVGDTTPGGSTKRGPRMTAYRQDALRCVAHIARSGPSPVKVIRKETGVTRAGSIFLSDVYGWFIREERGIYGLSPKGKDATVTFAFAIAALDVAVLAPSGV